MPTTSVRDEKAARGGPRPPGRNAFYASETLAAKAQGVASVSVDISLNPAPEDLARLERASRTRSGPQLATLSHALRTVASEFLNREFAAEFVKVVDAYRAFLRESLVKGEDPELQAALNQARLQEKILASTSMVDQAQACELLGLSGANPSATMKRKAEKREVLRFTVEGRAVYPLLQFDVEGRRVFPAMAKLIAAKPDGWSDFRLLHWLTRPHLDFDGAPGDALGADEPAVLAAFAREIEPAVHG